MPIEQLADRVILKHPKGATVEILHYGATVISWKSPGTSGGEPLERLFVSSKAALDGSKPVRGGIPIVFPVFGAPVLPQFSKLKQHGYARCSIWNLTSVPVDDASTVSVKLSLGFTPEVKAVFDFPVSLEYVVTLSDRRLGTDLRVTNQSDKDELQFQALFHNYIRAPANDVKISPLTGKNYFDKTEATAEAKATAKLEQRREVDVRKPTDSVYVDGGQAYEITWPNGGIQIKTECLKDVVIWNPQETIGKTIGDMEDGGWEKYVCVEPGHVQGYITLPVGGSWVGRQTLRDEW
ncbi:galactose mutarotase-like protein [Thelephora terrestris]|uniref:Glucose-6-phosphate 1-epimerase n=1 Tax=Thelephora terrestris TaxID=56493 RepID=A0A9P6L7Q1_9AGAM|nr:galactose mutarotase-like protein [Thelephora terrestris]